MNKISDYLPQSYRNTLEMGYMFTYVDEATQAYSDRLSSFTAQYLTISTATSDGLDFMAELNGLAAFFWSKSWNIGVKRTLISNYKKIITERGNRDLVNWLFDTFGLTAKLKNIGGWIVGVSTLPVTLGGNVFQFNVEISRNYTKGTPERTIIDLIIDQFVPDFISVTIISV